MPRSLLRLLPVLALALASALGIAACGDDAGGSSGDAQKLLEQTFSGNKKVDSGKLNVSMTADLKGSGPGSAQFEDPVTIRITGPFQSRGDDELPALDLDITASSGGQTFTAGAISTGEQGYLNYQGTDYVVPDKTFEDFRKGFEEQQKKEKGTQQPDLGRFGINPQKWLRDPKIEGEEEVGGAETTHVAAGVDVPALLDDLDDLLKRTDELGLDASQRRQLPTQLDAATKKRIEKGVKEAKVDIYTGRDDKTLRRLQIQLEFEVPKELRDQAQGLDSGKLEIRLEVGDLNEPQTIEAPKDARPLSELQQQLGIAGLSGGGLGGSGSSGGQGGQPSGSGSAAPGSKADSARAQKYLECAKKANAVEELQACGDLLK